MKKKIFLVKLIWVFFSFPNKGKFWKKKKRQKNAIFFAVKFVTLIAAKRVAMKDTSQLISTNGNKIEMKKRQKTPCLLRVIVAKSTRQNLDCGNIIKNVQSSNRNVRWVSQKCTKMM